MDLRITIGGTCLFDPEPSSLNFNIGRMFVHMPKVRVAGHDHGSPPGSSGHIPVLGFDTAHLRQGMAVPDGSNAQFKMFGWDLNIPGVGANLDICRQIPNLRPYTGRRVEAIHRGMDTTGRNVARLTLDTGEINAVQADACWEWEPGTVQRIAHRVEWKVTGLSSSSLDLVFTAMNGSGRELKLPKLYPIGNVISLSVDNVPLEELPLVSGNGPEPQYGDEPQHFRAFYRLFGGPVPVKLPRYWGGQGDCPPPGADGDCRMISSMGGSPFTCMVAAAYDPPTP